MIKMVALVTMLLHADKLGIVRAVTMGWLHHFVLAYIVAKFCQLLCVLSELTSIYFFIRFCHMQFKHFYIMLALLILTS